MEVIGRLFLCCILWIFFCYVNIIGSDGLLLDFSVVFWLHIGVGFNSSRFL